MSFCRFRGLDVILSILSKRTTDMYEDLIIFGVLTRNLLVLRYV